MLGLSGQEITSILSAVGTVVAVVWALARYVKKHATRIQHAIDGLPGGLRTAGGDVVKVAKDIASIPVDDVLRSDVARIEEQLRSARLKSMAATVLHAFNTDLDAMTDIERATAATMVEAKAHARSIDVEPIHVVQALHDAQIDVNHVRSGDAFRSAQSLQAALTTYAQPAQPAATDAPRAEEPAADGSP